MLKHRLKKKIFFHPAEPRRSTIAKLHNLPLEAPITKIITLLAHASHDSDSPEVASQIGQVKFDECHIYIYCNENEGLDDI